MSGRSLWLLVLFVSLVGLVSGQGCPSAASTGESTASGVIEVAIRNFAFIPKSVNVQAGQAVRWKNYDITPYWVRSGNPEDPNPGALFESGRLRFGETFLYTFNTPGTYTYHDAIRYNLPDLRDASVLVIPQ